MTIRNPLHATNPDNGKTFRFFQQSIPSEEMQKPARQIQWAADNE